ncbi:MAG: hypothetical protein V3U96_07950 [Paracoccaceae bacterium]
MMDAAPESLHSLLFEEGRQLENIKFFPGTDRGLTAEKLCNAADKAIRSALDKGPIDVVPHTGREKTSI